MQDSFNIPLDNFTENYTDIIASFQNNLFIYDKPLNAVLITTYVPLFLIALTSNILIILVVSRYRCLRSVTNYFLVNLSVADLLVTIICMPIAVGQAVHSLWLYGATMCKLTYYLQGVAVSASVFTITAMSMDRYLAIRHPMSRKLINRRTTRKVIMFLWILSLVIFAPLLLIRKTTGFNVAGKDYVFCVETWPDSLSKKTFGTFCFIVVYAIPGTIVVLAYLMMGLRLCSRQLIPEYQLTQGPSSPNPNARNGDSHCDSANSTWQVSSAGGRLIRERRRVAKILLILALFFAFCWLPYSVLSLILDMTSKADVGVPEGKPPDGGHLESEGESIVTLLLPFAILLGHVNSAVNPILYCLLSKNFRRSISEMIRHPARAARGRQHCKIRMTFRKEPAASKERVSGSKELVGNNRPRNHHAPDPPQASGSGCGENCNGLGTGNVTPKAANDQNSMFKEPTELCIVDLKAIGNNYRDGMLSYSPSSSGYSSLRHSTDTLTFALLNKDVAHVYTHSSQYPYFPSGGAGNISGCNVTSNPLQSNCGGVVVAVSNGTQNGSANWNCSCGSNGSIKRSAEGKKLHVPSTICEESESSQRSRSFETMRGSILAN